QDAQQPPPPQPPQPQPRQPRQPPQPRQPRQPPQRQPQAICCAPAVPCSLSNRWNVARLTSAISSSPRSTDSVGEKFSFCGVSAFGRADAEAPPAREKVKPAAPNAGIAALVTRFRLEACFDIVASPPVPVMAVRFIQPTRPYAEGARCARPAISLTCCCTFSFYSY